MSCNGTSTCDCGCCAGVSVQTPQTVSNLAGLSSVSYRAGTWAAFKESMLARLSSAAYPALGKLKTRDDDDFTIALIDASAVVLDILTFYQERLANESYLRTAGQLRSLVELSRLIGYQPAPGVSASAYLAFTLKTAPGQAPDPTTPAITIPKGTQVQSVPAQGQTPQTFETFADIQAKPDWNALPVQTGRPWVPGTTGLYLSGTSTQLKLGDMLLILGIEREKSTSTTTTNPGDEWDVVILNTVQLDNVRNLTFVDWDTPLTHWTSGIKPAWTTARVFAFRQKAALFGNNAPNPNLFVTPSGSPSFPNLIDSTTPKKWTWWNFQIPSSSQIDLDNTYQKIVSGSWFVLRANSTALLLNVSGASSVSRADFTLSGKVTELVPDYAPTDPKFITTFSLPLTEVWAQNDELAVAEQPLDHPLYGASLDLEDLRPDLVGAQLVAISGKRQKIRVVNGAPALDFIPDETTAQKMSLNPGDVVTLIDPAPLPLKEDGLVPDWSSGPPISAPKLRVEDGQGRPGTVTSFLKYFALAPSDKTDQDVSEYAMVVSVDDPSDPFPHTRFVLKSALTNCYDRATTTVNANVGLATHGQSVTEILGSGSATTGDKFFTLKHTPLTFVQAPTPTGRQSTLQVRANGMAWTEVPGLYNQGPFQQVYATLNQSDGTTDVLFGDGVEGARLPTGQNNIQASYRYGLGSAGNVGADSLTTLLDRPLGVSGVTNPEPATGGQDADTVADIRSKAPQTVMTMGRAVSITDYQNYAANFAGIAKAYALWLPGGPGRGVFLTVAGVDGAALPSGNPTLTNLVTSLQNFGNPLVPITALSFLETLFGLSANLKYDPAYDPVAVQSQVLQTLYQTYSFANRTFGQGVSADEVTALIQAVPGVVAVNVINLKPLATSAGGDLASQPGGFTLASYSNWLTQQVTLPRPSSNMRICAYLPVANLQSLPMPAEILVLDPNPNSIVLGVMP